MTLKEKFNSIDQSRITADQKAFLDKMKNVTKDFTLENKEVNDKVEGALDKMIASFKEKMPDAIKTTKKVVVPATEKTKKTTKVVSKTTTPKRTVMSLAKEIRKDGESWKDAQKRAGDIIKEDKADVSEVVKKELDRINKFINSRAELKGISGTNIKRDAVRTAKPRGVRTVTKSGETSNQYGTFSNKLGRRYWESRDRHADRLAPNYPKDAPLLAEGGYLTDPTFGSFQNSTMFAGGGGVGYSKKERVIEEMYGENESFADGGKTVGDESLPKAKFLQNVLYKNRIWEVTQQDGKVGLISEGFAFEESYDFIPISKINVEEVTDMRKNKLKFPLTADGFDNAKFDSYADGGFMEGYYDKGGSIESLTKELYRLQRELNSSRLQTYRLGDNSQEAKDRKKEREVKLARFNEVLKELRESDAKFELGGVMATDLAGHTGGALGTGDPTMLDGFSNTGYTGLVGETGAMSSGEMFENGGGLPSGVSQAYMITESFGNPAQHYSLGGNVVTDLAGHTGGGNGGLNAGMHLDGFSNTAYTGLVGETGAMSSGEMFANGGGVDDFKIWEILYLDKGVQKSILVEGDSSIIETNNWKKQNPNKEFIQIRLYRNKMEAGGGLPSDVSQAYMITESFGNPAQHYVKGGGIPSKYEIDRFKQVMNGKVIAKYIVRLNASFGNKETYVFGIRLRDQFKGCELSPYEVLYGGWEDGGTPFSLSNLQVKELVPNSYTKIELDEEETADLVTKLIKQDKAGVEKFLNTNFFYLTRGNFDNILQQHFQKSVVKYVSSEFSITTKFDKGGAIKNQYEGRTPEDVWNNWTEKQKNHFLTDHKNHVYKYGNLYDSIDEKYELINTNYFKLPKNLRLAISDHIETGEYKGGGMLDAKERYVLEIKGLTGLRKEAIENYIAENNLSDNDVLNIVIGLGRKQLKGTDVASAVVGKKGNALSKKVIQFAKDNKGMKLEEGGQIDAFTLRLVKGTGGRPDEAIAEPRSVQFAGGGGVSQKEKREDYLEKLMNQESRVWDKIGANSGGEIRQDKTLLRKYAEGVQSVMEKEGVGYGSFDQEDYEYFEDQNYHLLNDFLVWNNYFEPTMTKDEKSWRQKMYDDDIRQKGKSTYTTNPEIITISSTTSKSKSDKDYIVNADIVSVIVKKGGKEVTYSGKDVLNGANVLAEGGGIEDKAFYFSKNNVVSVELKNGKTIKPANGYWVDKDATPIKKMNTGGGVEDNEVKFITYKDEEIMYEPTYSEYFVNDEQFMSLQEAKNYIDKGSPMSNKTINAYRKGAFSNGGGVGMTKSIGLLYNKTRRASKDSGDVVYLNSENINLEGYTNLKPYSAQASDEEIKIGFSIPNQKTMVYFSNETTKKNIDRTSFEKYNGSIYIAEPLTEKIAIEILKKIKFFEKYIDGGVVFEKGDEVIYLGKPAIIKGINTDMFGKKSYKVAYDSGNGTTVADYIYNKGNEIVRKNKYDNGGRFSKRFGINLPKFAWEEAEIGDSAKVKEINRMGLIVKIDGRKFHLKFPNGTEKTFDASSLKFFKSGENKYDNGGVISQLKIGDVFKIDSSSKYGGLSLYVPKDDSINVFDNGTELKLIRLDSGGDEGYKTFSLKQGGDNVIVSIGNTSLQQLIEDRKSLKKVSYANGGAFEKLSDKVAKNYEGKRVKPQYQKEYGKVYSKDEAKEVGDKVAGKVKASQKMNTGGETKKGARGGIMTLAKQIRKDGEKWTDAVKRAGKQLK